MLDTLRFEPDEVEVAPGETVTFVLQNPGAIVHEFTIGDEAFQEDHEEEMAKMAEMGESMMMEDERNGVSVAAGETRKLTWRFRDESGELLFGCHQPGHYPGGMVGTIKIG